MKKRFFLLFVMVGLLVTLASCAASNKYVKLTLDSDYYEVYKGQTLEILPSVNKGSSVGDVTIEYSSYDESVATYANGKLQGVEYGETIIKVVYAGNATICDVAKVVVVEHDLAAEVGVDETPIEFYETDSYVIPCVEAPEAIYTFESSNNDVATVDANGKVTATLDGAQHNDGKAVITVTASDIYGVVEDIVYEVEVTVKEAHFAITLDLAGGVVGEYAPEYDYHVEYVLPIPTRAGYTFEGWLAEDGSTVATIPAHSEGAVKFVAQWKEITYTVKYELNGGVNAESNPVEYESDADITLAEPTKEGHTFAGWYVNGELVTKLPTTAYDHLVVVAKWTVNQYTIKFVVDGKETVLTQDFGSEIVAPETVKEGYSFAKWDKEVPATMPVVEGELVITAEWTINKYIITIVNDAEADDIDVIVGNYGATLPTIGDPVKEGHTFAGYDKEIPATMPAEDLVITAKWTVNQYTIRFDSVGGTRIPSFTADYGTEVPCFINPEKEGHTFLGWDPEVPATVPAENVTLTAKWEVNKYTITYEFELDALINENATEFTYGVGYTLVDANKPGYIFQGWFDAEDNKVTEIAANTAKDVTLYGKFVKEVYTVTFDSNGGEAVEPIEFTISDKVELPVLERLGYTFLGWFNGETKVEEIAAGTIENLELVAEWEKLVYYIKFSEVGGTDIPNLTYSIDSGVVDFTSGVVTINGNEYNFAKEGHTFLGWTIGASGFDDRKAYGPSLALDPVELFTKGVHNDIFAVAKWQINDYTITYVVDGEETVEKYQYNAAVTAPADPEKVGHTFAGWDVEVPTTMPGKDLVINAKFNVNNYVVKLFGTLNIAQPYGSDYVVRGTVDPVKEGYTFVGWDIYKEGETGDGVADELPLTVPAYNTIAMPVFEINQYTVSFDSKGGSEVAAITQDYNTALVAPADPTKLGNTFLGWDVNGDGNVDAFPATVPAEDITLEAVWDPDSYAITYVDGGLNSADFPKEYDFGFGLELPVGSKPGYVFLGWFADEKLTEAVEAISATDTGAKTLYGAWDYAQLTLTFDANGGKAVEAKEFTIQTKDWELPATTKAGYTFAGWFNGENEVKVLNENTESFTVVAKWTPNVYSIKFDVNGVVTTLTQDFGTEIVAPTELVKEGHKFAGWDKEVPATMPVVEDELVITAKWTVNTYVVTFVVDGVETEVEVEFGAKVEAIANPEKANYDFVKWTPALPATMPAEDLEVAAVWKATVYTITYVAPEGVVNNNPATYTVESAAIEFVPFITDHIEFLGWYADAALTEECEGIAKGSSGNVTVYAKYQAAKYAINYVLPGIHGEKFVTTDKKAPEAAQYEYGTVHQLENLELPGYTFDGWFVNGVKVTEINAEYYEANTDLKFTPAYTMNTYTLTFHVDIEGVETPAAISYNVVSSVDLPKLTAEGYNFLGWGYYAEGKFYQLEGLKIEAGNFGNITLYAVWETIVATE